MYGRKEGVRSGASYLVVFDFLHDSLDTNSIQDVNQRVAATQHARDVGGVDSRSRSISKESERIGRRIES